MPFLANTYWYVKAIVLFFIVAVVVALVMVIRPFLPGNSTKGTETDPQQVVDASGVPTDASGTGTAATVGNPKPAVGTKTTTPGNGGTPTQGTGTAGGTPPLAADTPRVAPEVMRDVQQNLALARQKLAANSPLEAREILDALLADARVPMFSDAWDAIVPMVNEVNAVFLFTDAPSPEKTRYTVKAGDSLWKLSRDYKTTVPMIQKNNRLDETNPTIMPGQTLHILQADWRIDISKSHYTLLLYNGSRLVRVYRIGVGRQDRTPEARFLMVDKVRNPPWTYQGRTIPFGDPENVLGTRWMKLEAIDEKDKHLTGYGIHGTAAPDSIGTAASNGCIRMKNEQVEELFDIVPVKIPVTIRD